MEGDPRHLDILKGYFGMNDRTKALTKNGYDDDREQGGARKRTMSSRGWSARTSGRLRRG